MQEDEDTENLCREYAFGSLDGVNPVPALGSPNKTLVLRGGRRWHLLLAVLLWAAFAYLAFLFVPTYRLECDLNENADVEEREDGFQTEDGTCVITGVRLLLPNYEIGRFRSSELDAEVKQSHVNSKNAGRAIRYQVWLKWGAAGKKKGQTLEFGLYRTNKEATAVIHKIRHFREGRAPDIEKEISDLEKKSRSWYGSSRKETPKGSDEAEAEPEPEPEPVVEEAKPTAEELADRPKTLYLADSQLFWALSGLLFFGSLGGLLPFLYPISEELSLERAGDVIMKHTYVHKKLSCVLCKAADVKAAEVKKDSFATRSSKRASATTKYRFRLLLRLQPKEVAATSEAKPALAVEKGAKEDPTAEKPKEVDVVWLTESPCKESTQADKLKERINQWLRVENATDKPKVN